MSYGITFWGKFGVVTQFLASKKDFSQVWVSLLFLKSLMI